MPAAALRIAGPQDVPALVALIDSAYRGEQSYRGWTTEAHLLGGQRTDAEALHEIVSSASGMLLAAELDGELVGCCQLELGAADGAYFAMFAVRPERQGGGLGRAIVGEAERRARDDWGARRMRMTVIRQRSDLIAWYERLGYHPTGRTSPFPYGNERYGVPRRPDLEFVELAKDLVVEGGA